MSITKKGKGKKTKLQKELLAGWEHNPAKAKIRISIWIDGDVLMAAKERAKETSAREGREMGYQTLMNRTLREEFCGSLDTAAPEAVAEVQQGLKEVRERLAKLERGQGAA